MTTKEQLQTQRRRQRLFFCGGLFLLSVEEAADAVEGAGFAEDDHALEERGRHGAARDDGAEKHEVFFDRPLSFFA